MKLLRPDRTAASGLSRIAALFLVVAGSSVAFASAVQEGAARPNVAGERRAAAAHDLIGAALDHLVAAQRADGAWPANADGRDPRQNFAGAGELDDVGVTGLVLLALADAPAGVDVPKRREALRRGLGFLAEQQEENGSFAPSASNSYAIPSHALALTAFVHVERRRDPSPEADWRAPAQRAVDFALAAHNPYMGWRYGVQPDGDNDSVMTSWMLMALAEAHDAGLAVDLRVVDQALYYLDTLTDPTTGRTGYVERGVSGSRLWGKAEAYPLEHVELETAIALGARNAWPTFAERGLKSAAAGAAADPLTSAALVVNRLPVWDTESGAIDVYAWAYGARAVQPIGGALVARWNAALVDALLAGVTRDADGRASFEPLDAWHREGQGVAMTAWCVRALEALP